MRIPPLHTTNIQRVSSRSHTGAMGGVGVGFDEANKGVSGLAHLVVTL